MNIILKLIFVIINMCFCVAALKIYFFDLTVNLNIISWIIISIIVIFLLLSILYIIRLLTCKKKQEQHHKSNKDYNCKTYAQAVSLKIRKTLKLTDEQAD